MQRSTAQNKAIHKLFEDVSREMLNQGIERKTVLNDLEGYSCPIDAAFLKEVWRAVMYTQTQKKSTTQMETAEVDKVYETFNRFLSEEYGIHCGFPSIESLLLAHEESQV